MDKNESIEKFKNYDFFGNKSWILFMESLYPTPRHDQIEKYKRKWYKKEIDKDFPIDFDEKKEEPKPQPNPNTNTNETNPPQEEPNRPGPTTSTEQKPFWKRAIFQIDGSLKVFFFFCLFTNQRLNYPLSFIICILSLLRLCGLPQWSKEYGRKVLYQEYFQNITYLIAIIFIPPAMIFLFYLPIGIHFWIGVCQYFKYNNNALVRIGFVKKAIDVTTQQRDFLIFTKNKIEIQIFILLFFMAFFSGGFIVLIFYGNYLKMKYPLNGFLQNAFSETNYTILGLLNKPFIPNFVRMLYGKLQSFCRYMVQ